MFVRRALSLSYCAAWLRPVENCYLTVSQEVARTLPPRLQDMLGYTVHDAMGTGGGLLGLYDGGDPRQILQDK